MNSKIMKIEKKLMKLNDELVLRQQAVVDKMENDIKIWGKPLGNKQLVDRVLDTEAKILEQKDKLNKVLSLSKERQLKKFALSNQERRVLDAVRNNSTINNTRTATGNRCDNRFNGSYTSRRIARNLHRVSE